MSQKHARIGGWALSVVGILVLAALLVLINYVASQANLRADLTEDRLYTLSSGSRDILGKLESNVTLRFYYTPDAEEVPVFLKSYARRVEDLLAEYQRASNGKVKVKKLNPKPDSDEEDSAVLDGIEGKQLSADARFYLGIAVNCVDATETLPFLSPADENNLEYNLTRAIYRVSHPHRTVVGVMSSQQVMGQEQNPMMMMMQQNQSQPPWMFVTELKKDCEVREVPLSVGAIDEDIDVLIAHHPKDLSESAQYAIDQFILRGGRLIAFLDPYSEFEQQANPTNPMMRQMPGSSSLPRLLAAWGIGFDTEKVVVDRNFAMVIQGRGAGGREMHPSVLSMDQRAVNLDDPVTNSLDRLIMADAGEFTGDPVAGLTKTVLLHSTPESGMVEKFQVMQKGRPGYGQEVMGKLKIDDRQKALAIRLTGKFKTAFPEGRPAKAPGAEGEEPTPPADPGQHLAESSGDGAVVLIGDSDILMDGFWIQRVNLLGQQLMQVTSDNNFLLQNALEQLGGDSALIAIRSRGVTNRPFEEVARIQQSAEEKFTAEIQLLETELQEIQRNINDLMRTSKDQGQQVILSPEVQQEIETARKKKVEASKRLKEVRKQFRREIDVLETFLTWANIAFVPFLIAHFGLILAVFRRHRKTSQ